jgi:hypothetical protein
VVVRCERPQLYRATAPATGLHPSIVDPTQSQRPRALNTPTFLIDWHPFRATMFSNIREIAHRSRHLFQGRLSPRVGTRERCTPQRSLFIGIGRAPRSNIGKIPHRSGHPFHTALISRPLVRLAPSCVEAFIKHMRQIADRSRHTALLLPGSALLRLALSLPMTTSSHTASREAGEFGLALLRLTSVSADAFPPLRSAACSALYIVKLVAV